MLFDAAATASSLLKGAMPSFGFGIVDGSWFTPPLPFTVCPVVVPPAELEVVSVALLFSIVPTKNQMGYKVGTVSSDTHAVSLTTVAGLGDIRVAAKPFALDPISGHTLQQPANQLQHCSH